MKRFLLVTAVALSFGITVNANHITGGEMYYTLTSRSGNSFTYFVTLKLFRDCNSTGAQLDPSASIAIFDRITGATVWSNSNIPRSQIQTLTLGSPDPCINNPPNVCYNVGYYTFSVTLTGSPNGYIIAYQRCCRIAGINNVAGSSTVGATYTAEIPGTSAGADAPENNSARFIGQDTVIVCANNAFDYSFGAIDTDPNDSLVYSFCNAYQGGSTGMPAPSPPSGPSYASVPYNSPFSATSPLGNTVTLNSRTGLISGVAPSAGIYVVTVCVSEYRSGVLFATQRKDLQIKVGDCDRAAADLKPEYVFCDRGNSFAATFNNLSSSPLITSFFWDFGVTSQTNDTSNVASPTFIYPDTGVYIIKLVTNRNQSCSDSTTAVVKVYPGFRPAFDFNGICINKPTNFTDRTTTNYGVVDTWRWNFGDPGSSADTSRLRNPTWTYNSTGPKTVTLTATSSKGCSDTAIRVVDIIDKPPIALAFRDTLICVPDVLQLQASGMGVFSWGPNVNIINANTATPTVNPATTTVYNVTLNDNGCINTDSVRVRVVTFVTLNAINDTTICQGDAIQLNAFSNGLSFQWTPGAPLSDANIINPIAITNNTTQYRITARIGSCIAVDDVVVRTVAYPIANAGPDQEICHLTSTQLNGNMNGSSFNWSPGATLSSTSILNPIAFPKRTTSYILSAFDTLGCPKPGRDTVLITVLPKMNPFAGRDTAVVVGEELQFNASGGVSYLWTPPTGLSSATIANPIGSYTGEFDSIRYKLYVRNEANCLDSATVLVKIFKTSAYVFVPSAFTPNGDGLNDILAPIAVGIRQIEYFRIFNRWGQLVFSTTVNGRGWDGKISGSPQGTNTFVWICSAIDYTGKRLFLKGTSTLIR
jgi:gliding motility-associated-like protein